MFDFRKKLFRLLKKDAGKTLRLGILNILFKYSLGAICTTLFKFKKKTIEKKFAFADWKIIGFEKSHLKLFPERA